MIIDAHNLYSQNQVVTATAASTNVIDTGPLTGTNAGTNLSRNIGIGRGLYLVVLCTAAMTDGGSDSTVTVTMETDADPAMGSPATSATVGTFAALTPAGTMLIRRISHGDMNEQYSQLRYTVANGNLTTGKFTAALVSDVQDFIAYAKAQLVD